MRKTYQFGQFRAVLGAAAGAAVLLASPAASAQIKQPGAHPDYSVEIEPHFVFQWTNTVWGEEGFGGGVRFNVPLMDNGPIDKINNNMAIGFGLDYVHFDDICRHWWGRWWSDPRRGDNCSADVFWFPVVLQWNFFLTPIISVFGEPGFAIAHRRFEWEWWCGGAGGAVCEYDDTDTDLEFVFWAGARFMFSESVGATVRVGTPYISAGINFML
jgi:hypothetical protein